MNVFAPVRAGCPVSVFKVVPSQSGGWSLMPMENLLRGLRNASDTISLELFGVDGVINYGVRTTEGESVNGMFNAYFPQALISSHIMGDVPGQVGEEDAGDWMILDEDEHALVQPLGLLRDSYLPLRVIEDRVIQQAEMDPLAGVIGVISGSTSPSGGKGSNRMGIRLVIRPAPENWNASWQNLIQARRDGEDRSPKVSGGPPGVDSGPSMGMVLSVGAMGGVGLMNWFLWNSGNIPGMVLFDSGMAAAGFAGLGAWRKFGGHRKRPYLDEALVEEKLKSLGFWTELQIVRIYRWSETDLDVAEGGIEKVMNCIRSFDDPAGNSWDPGKVIKYDGGLLNRGRRDHPFVGGSQILGPLNPKRASRTVLSAREVASIWHLPLGMSEMASMERIASGALVPFLGDLSSGVEDSGPLVGKAGNREIRLPESSIRKHAVILGRSGTGKSTLIKHIIDYKLQRKAAGKDEGAIVVIDPHADLVREILHLVPQEIAHKVRLLDFGRMDRVPGINLVDPKLFPDRDRCVDTIINTVKNLWEHWGSRLEDLLKNALLIVYEFNSHPDTRRDEMLTMLDILGLLEDGEEVGQGRNSKTEMSPFQRRALSRVKDPRLKQWFHMYLGWPRETRAEAVGPVHSRVGAYAANQRASVVMGQRESTIMFSDVLSEGLVLLVSTAQGTIGVGPAALMGGTIVSLVDSALREQESIEPDKRAKCLLVCDEFQTVTGADWEGMFAESRKYGCSLMLATQSLARLDRPERNLKAGVLGNVGVIVGYQMAAEDARIISAEMDSDRVPEQLLVNLNPYHCCVRINSDTTCYPAFSMKTAPPPDLSHGSDEAVRAVLEASMAYTVDYAQARERMDQDVQQWLDSGGKLGGDSDGKLGGDSDGKLGGDSGGKEGDTPGPTGDGPDASESPSGMYEMANFTGAADRPNRATGGPNEGTGGPNEATGGPNEAAGGPNRVTRRAVENRRQKESPSNSGSESVAPEPAVSDPAVSDPAVPVPAGSSGAGTKVASANVSRDVSTAASRNVSRNASTDVPGLDPEDVRESKLAPEVLRYILDQVNYDRGLRKAIDRRMGNQVSRAYRRARVEAKAEAEAEFSPRVDAEVAEKLEVVREEALVQFRREMADSLSGSGSGSDSSSGSGSGRSLKQLRRPGS